MLHFKLRVTNQAGSELLAWNKNYDAGWKRPHKPIFFYFAAIPSDIAKNKETLIKISLIAEAGICYGCEYLWQELCVCEGDFPLRTHLPA